MTRDATEILEPFRKYLKVLAELHLDRRLRGKLDLSDVVQQTMLRAYSALAEVRDGRPEVLVAWLRRILARTLADAVKHYERDKRDIGLERSLEADMDRSASCSSRRTARHVARTMGPWRATSASKAASSGRRCNGPGAVRRPDRRTSRR
jgi:DNA-directed RNA polymerase specialized sigma24 family protein